MIDPICPWEPDYAFGSRPDDDSTDWEGPLLESEEEDPHPYESDINPTETEQV